MKGKVSLVIPNCNGRRFLETCFEAALSQDYPDYEVILVDNASSDGSVELVRESFPRVRIIQNEENLGFAAAVNAAIRLSCSEYVALLNNDTRAERKWLGELVRAMERRSQVGMCASKMLFYHQPQVVNSAGTTLDRAGVAWDRLGGVEDSDSDQEQREVFGPCAGAALYRRQMLEEVGLFDEDFFAYLEDVDLAWRARLVGWECSYVPSAIVYHIHSATGAGLKNYLLGRNKIWMLLKNYPTPDVFLYFPLIALYDLPALFYHLAVERDVSALMGRLAALRKLPRFLQKRRGIQRLATTEGKKATRRLMENVGSPLKLLARYRGLGNLG